MNQLLLIKRQLLKAQAKLKALRAQFIKSNEITG